MSTPFTTSNAEETSRRTNKHCTVAKERKRGGEKETESWRSREWESLINIYNTVGNGGQTLYFSSSKPIHIANFDRVNSDTNLGFWQFKLKCRYDPCILKISKVGVLNKLVKREDIFAMYPYFLEFCTWKKNSLSNFKLTTSINCICFWSKNISWPKINKTILSISISGCKIYYNIFRTKWLCEGEIGGGLLDVTKPGCWCEVILRTQINTTCTYTLLLISPL